MRFVMGMRLLVSSMLMIFTSTLWASGIDTCIKTVLTHPKLHRLEKEENIKSCFEINKSKMTQQTCFTNSKKVNQFIRSTLLQTQIKNTCFYDTQSFKNVASCLDATKNFTYATDHDDAVFYCYQTFQDKLNQNGCIDVAQKMIFPLKKDYLKRHCLQNE